MVVAHDKTGNFLESVFNNCTNNELYLNKVATELMCFYKYSKNIYVWIYENRVNNRIIFFSACLAARFFDVVIFFCFRYDSSLQFLPRAPLATCLLISF